MQTSHFRTQVRTFVATALAALALPTQAAELVVKNDSMTDGSSVSPCVCFVQGDIPAAWLTAPADGKIVGVQIFWKSSFGGAFDTFEDFIRIYDGSTFPTPGAVLQNDSGDDAVVTGPITLSDGVLNEFRFLDQSQTIPMSVPVSAGQAFAVGLQIANQSSGGGNGTPSLAYDNDGCQNGNNAIYLVDSDTWFDPCSQLMGDWVIRAIIETPAAGACCLPDDSCTNELPEQCTANGGQPYNISCVELDAKGGCEANVPTVSQWGLAALALVLLTAGTVIVRRKAVPM